MRILVVAQDHPWPADYGSRLRLANVICALGDLGEIDLFSFLLPGTDHSPAVPDAVKRFRVFPRPPAGRTLPTKVAWLVSGKLPSEFLGRDFEPARGAFREWCRPPYDLIWFSRVESYVARV